MRNSERVLNSLAKHSKHSAYKYERLYRALFNEEMYYVAYQRIYAKPGNMTPGSDNKTVDGMNLDRIEKLIQSLKLSASTLKKNVYTKEKRESTSVRNTSF